MTNIQAELEQFRAEVIALQNNASPTLNKSAVLRELLLLSGNLMSVTAPDTKPVANSVAFLLARGFILRRTETAFRSLFKEIASADVGPLQGKIVDLWHSGLSITTTLLRAPEEPS